MTNHPNHSAYATIRRHMKAAGYSNEAITSGMEWAKQQGFDGAREGYILAMSRVLYDDDQLADGGRFSVEAGYGPR